MLWTALSLSIQQQSTALLYGATMLIPASLTLPSTTSCELWLDACVLPQRTIFLSLQASNLLSSLKRSHTVSIMPHGALTSAPLSAHLSIEWECTASQSKTPIFYLLLNNLSVHLTTNRSVVECREVGEHYKTLYCHPQPTFLEWHCQEQCAVVQPEWGRRGHGPPPETNLLRFSLVFHTNFQLFGNKWKEQ